MLKLRAEGWTEDELRGHLVAILGYMSRVASHWVVSGATLAGLVRGVLPAKNQPWHVSAVGYSGEPVVHLDNAALMVTALTVTSKGEILADSDVNYAYTDIFSRTHETETGTLPGYSRSGARSVRICEEWPYHLPIPANTGTVLDAWQRQWWELVDAHPRANNLGTFFNPGRIVLANQMLARFYELATIAGISDRMWLGFGGLLGLLRDGGWVPHDNDIDMCVSAGSDGTGEREYVRLLSAPGAYDRVIGFGDGRWRAPQMDTARDCPVWLSCGPLPLTATTGVKACHWFGFQHAGFWWHSKGHNWVVGKLNTLPNVASADAVALGMPSELVAELVPATFNGVSINVPARAGACLDCWYPGWVTPRSGGQSSQRLAMVIGKWADKSTWRIHRG